MFQEKNSRTMEFVGIATYNNEWKRIWLGPSNLLVKAPRYDNMKYRNLLFNKQGGRCNYCMCEIKLHPSADCDYDHIIPITHGGSCEEDNMQILCVCCHRQKSKFERNKNKITIQVNGARDGHIYITTTDEIQQNVKGKTNPAGITKIVDGLYEIDFCKRRAIQTRTNKRHKNINPQEYFNDKMSDSDLKIFKKYRRAVLNRILYEKYPAIERHSLQEKRVKNSIMNNHVIMDIKLFDMIDMIISELGLENVRDTTPFDLAKMEKEGNEKINRCLDTMDEMTCIKYSCSTTLTRMRHYFRTILGYNVVAKISKVRHKRIRTSYRTYFLSDLVGDYVKIPNTLEEHIWE